MGNSTRNMLPPLQMRSPQVSNGFAGRKVGTPQTHGGSSTGTQSGSKLQLKPTFTGTSLTACGGSMSPAETESTSPRRPLGPLHRLDGRLLDLLDRCQVWSPPSETFKSWHRRKSFVKIGPTPYLMAAFRILYLSYLLLAGLSIGLIVLLLKQMVTRAPDCCHLNVMFVL